MHLPAAPKAGCARLYGEILSLGQNIGRLHILQLPFRTFGGKAEE